MKLLHSQCALRSVYWVLLFLRVNLTWNSCTVCLAANSCDQTVCRSPLSFWPFVCLSVCLSGCLQVFLIWLFYVSILFLTVSLPVCLFVWLSASFSELIVVLSICLSMYPFSSQCLVVCKFFWSDCCPYLYYLPKCRCKKAQMAWRLSLIAVSWSKWLNQPNIVILSSRSGKTLCISDWLKCPIPLQSTRKLCYAKETQLFLFCASIKK